MNQLHHFHLLHITNSTNIESKTCIYQEYKKSKLNKDVSVNSNANIPDVSKMDKNELVMYAKYSYMKWRTTFIG